MPYYFLDYDDVNDEDLDIEKENYIHLISICFKYSKEFSLFFSSLSDVDSFNESIEPTRIEKVLSSDGIRNFKVFYECNSENEKQLLMRSDTLFNWESIDGRKCPEDLMFYKADNKLFFWSETHEGVCAIFDEGEDLSNIISQKGWRQFNPNEPNLYIPANLL